MKSSKGFTLIELLAVIVILAIIALIAAPVILNIIDDARKSAAKDSALGVVSAAKLHFAQTLLDTDYAPAIIEAHADGRAFICSPTNKICSTAATGVEEVNVELSVDGTIPDGTIYVANNGDIKSAELKFGGKYCFSVTAGAVKEETCK